MVPSSAHARTRDSRMAGGERNATIAMMKPFRLRVRDKAFPYLGFGPCACPLKTKKRCVVGQAMAHLMPRPGTRQATGPKLLHVGTENLGEYRSIRGVHSSSRAIGLVPPSRPATPDSKLLDPQRAGLRASRSPRGPRSVAGIKRIPHLSASI